MIHYGDIYSVIKSVSIFFLVISLVGILAISNLSLAADFDEGDFEIEFKEFYQKVHKYSKDSSVVKPAYVLIDEVETPIEKIIWDFTNVAFSNALWLENSFQPWDSMYPIKASEQSHERKKSDSRWLSEYTARVHGYPKTGVINKWEEEISVAIGWPQYQTDFLNEHANDLAEISEQLLFVEREVQKILPDLERDTGLKMSFRSHDDPREKTAEFAKIRIIPVVGLKLKNRYKFLVKYPPQTYAHNITADILESLVGAVPFTPNARAQVDGFILPKSNNDIGIVVCRVLPSLSKPMLTSLVSECLVRAMGLPNLSKINEKSLLGAWNSAEDSVSKIPSEDGRDAFVWGRYDGADTDVIVSYPENRLTSYDRIMLRLLYCPAIKKQMDRLQVIKTLYTTESCWKNIIEEGTK